MSIEQDCIKIQVVTDAMELLQDGFPLDVKTKQALGKIGINYVEFIRRFEIETTYES